jgi:DNA mismatch endonuclease, patch repair protein
MPSWRPVPSRPYVPRDPSVTSRMMRRVRGKENKAERMVRRELHRRGLRYRLQGKDLPGRPDIVFVGARVVVFVDGDFWHGRALVEGGEQGLRDVIRGARFSWWHGKLAKTVERDNYVTILLKDMGWCVVRVWESEVLINPSLFAERIERIVRRRTPAVGTRGRKVGRVLGVNRSS